MKESTFRRKVVQLLHDYSAFAVENPAWPGTPDVSTTVGWIELKILRVWPKRTGVVRVPHLTPVQRIWHMQWTKAGGQSWLLLMVEKDVLLIEGKDVVHVGNVSRAELLSLAVCHWASLRNMETNIASALSSGRYALLRRTTDA